MKEFVSIKVSSFDHDALATSLTAKSADGWSVVSIVSVNSDIVAYLSRETTERSVTAANDSSVGSTEPAGWGAVAASDIASSAPTQMVSTTPASDAPSTAGLDATASTSGTPSVPADWYKDPSGRFEYRYWDGQKWTEHVSRGGTVHKDPPTP